MSYVFPLAEINGLVDALAAEDVRASIDPALVNAPGVWVHLIGPLDHDTMGGSTLAAELVLVTRDSTDAASLAALAALHDAVLSVVDAAGPVRFQGTILPGPDLTPLPSLVVPVQITN